MFIFETALKIRLIALNSPSVEFEASVKLYLYKSLKILRNRKNSPDSTALVRAKSKVLIQFIQFLGSVTNHTSKQNKFLLSYKIKNPDLFLSKANKFKKKVVDFKKIVINITDNSARFRPYRPPTARNMW